MQTTHTPGPWVYRHSFDSAARRDIWTVTDATGHRELVATIPDAEGDHINANARLIAAAPDLLAALQTAENALRYSAQEAAGRVRSEIVGGWLYHADQCRAAIAKATGGQP